MRSPPHGGVAAPPVVGSRVWLDGKAATVGRAYGDLVAVVFENEAHSDDGAAGRLHPGGTQPDRAKHPGGDPAREHRCGQVRVSRAPSPARNAANSLFTPGAGSRNGPPPCRGAPDVR